MSTKELRLREYAGQNCDVVITVRRDSSAYIAFQSEPGYGYPTLEEGELHSLLQYISDLKEGRKNENINDNASLQRSQTSP